MTVFNGYKKGVNFGGWLSQCVHTKEHYDSFITADDFAKASKWGVDHIRLPIDYELLEEINGDPIDSGFSYIDMAVKSCRRLGLNIVIDLHKTAGYSFDAGEKEHGFFESKRLQERFMWLWERIAERYAVNDGSIAFELLNEVNDKAFAKTWNGIIKEVIGRIRVYAPESFIIVGGYWQNSPDAVPDLDPPFDDKVIYNFHCYDPFEFTHQGAYWCESLDINARIRIDNCDPPITPELFIGRFANAVAAAEKNGAALYCGEYGVIDNVEPEDAVKWYKAINAAFDKLGISRAAWSYKKMDFGISDERLDGVRDELVKYL